MALMPPFPALDSVSRASFEPVSIAIKPPAGLSVNNAIVQFGYQEYAQGGVPYCTTRLDACFANSAAVSSGTAPFLYGSESPAGLPCASSCTVAVPAISQRILYYQIQYRSASGAVLAVSPWQVVPIA